MTYLTYIQFDNLIGPWLLKPKAFSPVYGGSGENDVKQGFYFD